jgi:hypothetical protein
MTIDFSVLQDSVWIADREKKWKLIEEQYSDEYSRKEREEFHRYFMLGETPKNKKYHYTTCLELFPIQSKEGHEYVFKNYAVMDKWEPEVLVEFIRISLLGFRPYLTISERVSQFEWYLGKQYNPNSKFPFLIGDERECRYFNYDVRLLLVCMLQNLNQWLGANYDEDEPYKIEPYLMEFIFSLLKAQPSDWVSHNFKNHIVDSEDHEVSHLQERRIYLGRLVRDLMRKSITAQIDENNKALKQKKLSILADIKNRFNSMRSGEYPQSLIEHWSHIKIRVVSVKISFIVDDKDIEKWVNFLVGWWMFEDRSTLPEETDLDILNNDLKKLFFTIKDQYSTNEKLFFESVIAQEDSKPFDLFFTAYSQQVAKKLQAFFESCPLSDLKINIRQLDI